MKTKLLKCYIASNGNASKAGRMAKISEGHARKLLKNITVKKARKMLSQLSDNSCELIFPITDVHYGEVIEPVELNGFNQYNCKIARERLDRLFFEFISSIKDHHDKIHIVHMGDIISGMLHDENGPSDEMMPIKALNEIGRYLIDKIININSRFPNLKIEIHGVTSNHSRSTKKIWSKKSIETSYDYQLGQLMEIAFHDNEMVKVNPVMDDIRIDVSNMSWAISHGHWHTGGTVAGAFKGAAFQRLQAMEQLWTHSGFRIDACLIGHFHAHARLNDWFVAPALCGASEFETKKLGIKPYDPRGMIIECSDTEITEVKLFKL